MSGCLWEWPWMRLTLAPADEVNRLPSLLWASLVQSGEAWAGQRGRVEGSPLICLPWAGTPIFSSLWTWTETLALLTSWACGLSSWNYIGSTGSPACSRKILGPRSLLNSRDPIHYNKSIPILSISHLSTYPPLLQRGAWGPQGLHPRPPSNPCPKRENTGVSSCLYAQHSHHHTRGVHSPRQPCGWHFGLTDWSISTL